MSDGVNLPDMTTLTRGLSGRALIWINTDAVFIAIVHPVKVAMKPPERTQIGQ